MTSKVMRGRIADANRVRGLWVKSLEISPDMSEEERIKHIMKEAVRKTPAGGYMYLESFITADPTERWFNLVLTGRLDQNVHVGPSLLAPKPRAAPKGPTGMPGRMDKLEYAVRHIASQLDIDLTPILGETRVSRRGDEQNTG